MQVLKAVAIIDDDEEVRLSMGSLLRSYGYQTWAFASADAFLRSLEVAAYDCVVTDVDMPGMDGLAMVEFLRSRGGVVPIIAISALDPERTRALALAKGVDAYLAKPVDPDDLLDWMRRLCAGGGASARPSQAGNSG